MEPLGKGKIFWTELNQLLLTGRSGAIKKELEE
jgi:hypothetical protein